MTAIGATTISDLVRDLAARQPTPGGGAAAAVSAALGCAAGAMAARYTTGPKWAEVTADAERLAQELDVAAQELARLADEDAAAFTALQQARRDKQPEAITAAEQRALGVPVQVITLCVQQACALQTFLPRCNPYLISDVKVGIHLLAGAARAAWQTLLINRPPEAIQRQAEALMADLDLCDRAAQGIVP